MQQTDRRTDRHGKANRHTFATLLQMCLKCILLLMGIVRVSKGHFCFWQILEECSASSNSTLNHSEFTEICMCNTVKKIPGSILDTAILEVLSFSHKALCHRWYSCWEQFWNCSGWIVRRKSLVAAIMSCSLLKWWPHEHFIFGNRKKWCGEKSDK